MPLCGDDITYGITIIVHFCSFCQLVTFLLFTFKRHLLLSFSTRPCQKKFELWATKRLQNNYSFKMAGVICSYLKPLHKWFSWGTFFKVSAFLINVSHWIIMPPIQQAPVQAFPGRNYITCSTSYSHICHTYSWYPKYLLPCWPMLPFNTPWKH